VDHPKASFRGTSFEAPALARQVPPEIRFLYILVAAEAAAVGVDVR
jgi:hypothetical protein